MKTILSMFILAILCATTVFSQNKKEVLLTIDGNPVYAKEFKRVYKKNLNLVQDESQKDIDGYLQLFIDYKLKIAEAKAQHLNEESDYKKEFSQYRDQLSRNYLFEDKLTEDIAKEAYERGKEEVSASHILIRVGYDATPQDTLAAYNKIKNIREKALKGEDFTELAKKYSEEPGAKQTGGNVGYFSTFAMVYPFESAAYNTPKGEISDIVRTRYGYHILKVNDRREKLPKIAVSHIMISDKKGAKTFDPKERIEEIYTMLKQGQSFESLAKQFSDDKGSAVQGGKLKPFTRGDLRSKQFEDAAYNLKNVGDISQPVKSDFGWHIIRLDQKIPVETFEEQKEMLEKKVREGERAKDITTAINKKIKDKYGFKEGSGFRPYFNTYVTDSVLKKKWVRKPIPQSEDKTLFTIGNKSVKYSDFAKYIEKRQLTTRTPNNVQEFLMTMYDEFETSELSEYFKEKLEDENEDYAAILNEYREGLLIFDVMDKNIWQKAKNDSIGLQKFYDKMKQNYPKGQSIDGTLYSANSEAGAKQIQKLIAEGKTAEEIKTELNSNGKVNVIISKGNFETDKQELPKNLELKKGVSSIYPSNDSFVVVDVKDIIPAGISGLEEVKGKVLSDYQTELEKEWIQQLHSKYKVEVNKKTLKHVKKELKKELK